MATLEEEKKPKRDDKPKGFIIKWTNSDKGLNHKSTFF
jgi:hypothetical protein